MLAEGLSFQRTIHRGLSDQVLTYHHQFTSISLCLFSRYHYDYHTPYTRYHLWINSYLILQSRYYLNAGSRVEKKLCPIRKQHQVHLRHRVIRPILFHQTGMYSIFLLPIWVISMSSPQMKRSEDVGILFSLKGLDSFVSLWSPSCPLLKSGY